MFLLQTQNKILLQLEQWDKWLFEQINSHLTHSWLDAVMPFLRTAYNWAPLYLFLIVFAVINFKVRGWWWVVLFICTVSLTDMVSSHIFKEVFERLRPCQDPEFFEHVRLLLKKCSGSYSFTSSHAANHFGMATFFYFTARQVIGRWAMMAFLWAAAISYAQVYVGVHYPFDIIGGTALGLVFGTSTGLFFNKRFGFATFGK